MNTPIGEIAQLKVMLLGSKPQIWRRIEFPTACTLGDLHEAIQIIFGWEDAHLHEFNVNGRRFEVSEDAVEGGDVEDADGVLFGDLALPAGARILYTYDFGDNWEHGIEIEKYGRRRRDTKYPRCTKAVRAGPPEDCGGVHGYARMLRILANPRHSEYEDVQEWVGEDFDPKGVSVEELTDDMAAIIGAT